MKYTIPRLMQHSSLVWRFLCFRYLCWTLLKVNKRLAMNKQDIGTCLAWSSMYTANPIVSSGDKKLKRSWEGNYQLFKKKYSVNSLWPNDVVWRHRSWSTLAQVIDCCLMAPIRYPNQNWLIIQGVLCYYELVMNWIRDMCWGITLLTLLPHIPGTSELS